MNKQPWDYWLFWGAFLAALCAIAADNPQRKKALIFLALGSFTVAMTISACDKLGL